MWRLLSICVLLCIFFSCHREDDIRDDVQDIRFDISFEESPLVTDGIFKWSSLDKVAVSGGCGAFTISIESEGNLSMSGKAEARDSYQAVYPYEALSYFSPENSSEAVMTLPYVQTAVPGTIPAGTAIAAASSSEDMSFLFRNVLTYLKLTITPEAGKIRSISVVSADGTKISGDFSVDCTDPDMEVYPLPDSYSNIVLRASGQYIEPGDYYIAAFPSAFHEELFLAFEMEDSSYAMLSFIGNSEYQGGLVRDLGEVSYLDYVYDDVYSVSPAVFSCPYNEDVRQVTYYSDVDMDVKVTRGSEWIEIIKTKAVERNTFFFKVSENTGDARMGEIVAESTDGSCKLVYIITQRTSPYSDASGYRNALIELYDATNGDQWKNNANWCSDLPLSEWYGVTTYRNPDYSSTEVVQSISLTSNNLSGALPPSIKELSGIYSLSLSNNSLTGQIPASVFDNTNVYLDNNLFESVEEPESPADMMCYQIDLSGNCLSGSLPDFFSSFPGLASLDLSSNMFTGSIPSSYSVFFDIRRRVYLNANSLSGEIPDEIWNRRDFNEMWQNVIYQDGEGFDFSGNRLKAPFNFNLISHIEGSIYTGESVSGMDIYSQNEYTLIFGWQHIDEVFDEVSRWYEVYKDSGFDVLSCPRSSSHHFSNGVNWQCISYPTYNYALSLTYPYMLLVDRNGYIIGNPAEQTAYDILTFLEEKLGPYTYDKPEPEPDPEPELKPEVSVIQQASEGKGIDIVLMGDAYSAEKILDGTYEDVMREAMEAFFDVEPFSSYRHLFNVHMVSVPSANDGYSDQWSTPLECEYSGGTVIKGNDDACFTYASLALSEERLKEALVVVVMNSNEFGGSCYMYPTTEGDYSCGRAVAYIPKVDRKIDFRGLVQHEAGGHGFAKLADEYFEKASGTIPEDEIASLKLKEKYGWWKNVDFTDDASQVKWAHILSDERYAMEQEGLYPGALNYSDGIWRPAYSSIMVTNTGRFNAPSREAIWYRIHKLAYGDVWEYDFEDFASYDSINRSSREDEWKVTER